MVDHPVDVRLSVPARTDLVRVARLTARATASRLGFDVDELDELAMAVDEGCVVLMEAVEASASVDLRFLETDLGLAVSGRASATGTPPEVHEIAASILQQTTDTYDVGTDDEGHPTFRLVKLRGDVG